MEKRNVTIIVTGEAGTGKSTLAVLLEEFLTKQGFQVEMDLENEIIDYGGKVKFYSLMAEGWSKRLDILKGKIKITLKSM